jgi:gamma-glutamylcyclotransferase (GGCT)/AIG2-like uncharacterized protein YtfP
VSRSRQFVFGYGSLAAAPEPVPRREIREHGFVADLDGARRTWGVAMDNRRDLPGYKYYTDGHGARPAVYVAFLDLILGEPTGSGDATVNGLCLPVDDAMLPALDLRERNYERRDVSARVSAGGARVWAYVGSADGRERLADARSAGTAVIDAGYLRDVRAAFTALGEAEEQACRRSLQPAGIPVVELVRHELP